jgi:uncharacterized protein YyaL (SSP411 family)
MRPPRGRGRPPQHVTEEHLARVLTEGRKPLLEARARRIRPERDDWILPA